MAEALGPSIRWWKLLYNVQAPRPVYIAGRPVCTRTNWSTCGFSSTLWILVWSAWLTWSTGGDHHHQRRFAITNRSAVLQTGLTFKVYLK